MIFHFLEKDVGVTLETLCALYYYKLRLCFYTLFTHTFVFHCFFFPFLPFFAFLLFFCFSFLNSSLIFTTSVCWLFFFLLFRRITPINLLCSTWNSFFDYFLLYLYNESSVRFFFFFFYFGCCWGCVLAVVIAWSDAVGSCDCFLYIYIYIYVCVCALFFFFFQLLFPFKISVFPSSCFILFVCYFLLFRALLYF